MKPKNWWIKERYNPQLGVYYVAIGLLSIAAAKRAEKSLYGANIMHRYESVEAYEARLAELRANGKLVR